MWLTPGRASGRKNFAPKLFMMGTVQPIVQSWRLHQPWLKTIVREGGHTVVRLYPINEDVQPDVLQRGRAGMARQRSKTQDATCNVSSMVSRSGEVVDALHRRSIDFCCAQETRWKGESVRMLDANCRRYKLFLARL